MVERCIDVATTQKHDICVVQAQQLRCLSRSAIGSAPRNSREMIYICVALIQAIVHLSMNVSQALPLPSEPFFRIFLRNVGARRRRADLHVLALLLLSGMGDGAVFGVRSSVARGAHTDGTHNVDGAGGGTDVIAFVSRQPGE